MAEDEEGYRKLIDKKKDRRLAYLLEQTDEYITELTDMLQGHKDETAKKKKLATGKVEDDESDPRVVVVYPLTGETLAGDKAPRKSELAEFLEKNEGWKVKEEEVEKREEEEELTEEEKELKKTHVKADVEDEYDANAAPAGERSYYLQARDRNHLRALFELTNWLQGDRIIAVASRRISAV